MIKAIIQIRGYNQKKSISLRKSIIRFMKKTKMGSAISCEIVQSKISSCDGNNTPEPYLKIITAKRKYAATIIEGLKKNMIHELVVISLDNTFCGAKEIASGK
jgi:hypothetical protein